MPRRPQPRDPERAGRIVALREALDLSQERLAQQLGVSSRTVQNWEAGRTISQPGRLATALQSSVAYILHAAADIPSAADVRTLAEEAQRIGRLMADLRRQRGLSQEDLAREIGVGVGTISRWERGLHGGYGKNVRKLADALDVTPSLLHAVEPDAQTQLDRIEAKLDGLIKAPSERTARMTFPTFTWPDWHKAPRGTRFRNTLTGRTGTFIQPSRVRNNGAIVVWDDVPWPIRNPALADVPNSVNFVGVARDAVPIDPRPSAEERLRSAAQAVVDADEGFRPPALAVAIHELRDALRGD